jgi:hypothetical protein
MSNLKISTNMHLGKQEMQHQQLFLADEGYRRALLQNSASFGLLKLATDPALNNFKIQLGTNPQTVKLTTLSSAIDRDGLLLQAEPFDNLLIPDNGRWNYLLVEHRYSHAEAGTVAVAADGTLTGVGTKFLSCLRGGADYPSKIAFLGPTANVQEYEVVEVVSDTTAVLYGNLVSEKNQRFGVVGTFSPGAVPPASDRMIYEYDSCLVTVTAEIPDSQNAGAYLPPVRTAGKQFAVARVKVVDGNAVIEDLRQEFYQSTATGSLSAIPLIQNDLIGAEKVQWEPLTSGQTHNVLTVGFGFRSTNWSVDTNLRQITVASGSGGTFKTAAAATNNCFNGWRVYSHAKGTYRRVVSTVKSGSQFNVILDVLTPDDFNDGDTLAIVPDVEAIEISGTPLNGPATAAFTGVYPIHPGFARCRVSAFAVDAEYSVYYRFLNSGHKGGLHFLENDPVGYEIEASTALNPVVKPVTQLGTVTVVQSPESLQNFKDKIDTGDKFGVQQRTLVNASSIINLQVGRDAMNQVIEGTLILTVDHILNLKLEDAKPGNTFYLEFNNTMTLGNKSFKIVQNYPGAGDPAAAPSKVLLDFDTFLVGKAKGKNLLVKCVYNGQNWQVFKHISLEALDGVPVGSIVMTDETNFFDGTGKGLGRWNGWQVCDGSPGTPDLRGRFVVGVNPAETEFVAVGANGGTKNETLNISQIPAHVHRQNNFRNGATGSGGDSLRDYSSGGNTANTDTQSTGGGQPHNNLPPYVALLYVKRLS